MKIKGSSKMLGKYIACLIFSLIVTLFACKRIFPTKEDSTDPSNSSIASILDDGEILNGDQFLKQKAPFDPAIIKISKSSNIIGYAYVIATDTDKAYAVTTTQGIITCPANTKSQKRLHLCDQAKTEINKDTEFQFINHPKDDAKITIDNEKISVLAQSRLFPSTPNMSEKPILGAVNQKKTYPLHLLIIETPQPPSVTFSLFKYQPDPGFTTLYLDNNALIITPPFVYNPTSWIALSTLWHIPIYPISSSNLSDIEYVHTFHLFLLLTKNIQLHDAMDKIVHFQIEQSRELNATSTEKLIEMYQSFQPETGQITTNTGEVINLYHSPSSKYFHIRQGKPSYPHTPKKTRGGCKLF